MPLLTIRADFVFILEARRGELETTDAITRRVFSENEARRLYDRLKNHFDPETQ